MGSHAIRRHLYHRQISDPLAIPTGVAGISATATTIGTDAATGTGLSFDTAARVEPDGTAPPLAGSSSIVITVTPSQTPSDSVSSSVPTASAASASSSSLISMGTVVGACFGALAGALFVILIGVWLYRRSNRALVAQRRRGPQSPLSPDSRNARGEHARSQSRLETWGKLDDGEDKWEGMDQTKEVEPTDKLQLFKKSPSMRTTVSEKASQSSFNLTSYPFAKYHPNLAEELAQTPLPFLDHVEPSKPISWDAEAIGSDYISVRSGRMTGAMSPTLNMAIPTPPATSSELHRWETAEVMHYGEDVVVENPFDDQPSEGHKGNHNPFFSAQEEYLTQHAASKSHDRNPFKVDPQPKFKSQIAQHTPSDSTLSFASNERALLSLIAALDVSPQQVEERLRVASMQPSVVSETSMYAGDSEEDITSNAFPLPPQGKS